jgi:hypothetical protein
MNSHTISAHLKNFKSTVLVAALLVAFLGLCAVGVVPGTAQSSPEERELEDKIPKHLPIKVKVKNLNKQNWVREVEVEVTTTGDKPIYYLRFSLRMPEVLSESGSVVAVRFSYGRPAVGDFRNRPTAEDVPLLPGKTCILKVPKKEMAGWESVRDRRKWSEPKKFLIKFRLLHHGDGTGYGTSGGLPVPHPDATSSSCGGRELPVGFAQRATSGNELKPPPAPSFQFVPSLLPVRFLPAKLFVERTAAAPTSNFASPQAGVCCAPR